MQAGRLSAPREDWGFKCSRVDAEAGPHGPGSFLWADHMVRPSLAAHVSAQIVISAGIHAGCATLSRRVRYKGRCSGWLRCCDPRDPRPSDQCKKRHLKTARKLALEGLANSKSNGSQPLTLMEYHWPDSGSGWPHGPLTFLDLVPMMRAMPCRTVLVTVLRAPADLCTPLCSHTASPRSGSPD